jgi:hypothetical protein
VAGDRFNADPQSSYLRRKRQITFNSDTEFEASCVMFRLCPKVIPDAVQPFLQPLDCAGGPLQSEAVLKSGTGRGSRARAEVN